MMDAGESESRGTARRLERRTIPPMPRTAPGLRSAPAWAFSLLFHVCALVAIGVLWTTQPKGTGSPEDRPVGIAVVYQSQGGEEYYLGADSGSTGESASPTEVAGALPDANASEDRELEEMLDELLAGSAGAAGEASTAAGGLGLGDGGTSLSGGQGIPKVKTTVFGIEGEGTRFLYVFDRSDSMNGYGGRPFRAAKQQLVESLDSLGRAHQFQIIFYNDSPLPFQGLGRGGPGLLHGEESAKTAAKRFVREAVAVGGTQHIDALRMAIAMSPDVIFFLTDADTEPSARDIENLQVRASRIGATIHSIQFGAGPNQTGGGWLKSLAGGLGGQYRYIDVTKLPQS